LTVAIVTVIQSQNKKEAKLKRKEIVMISSASQLLRLYAFHSLHLAGCMNKTFKPS